MVNTPSLHLPVRINNNFITKLFTFTAIYSILMKDIKKQNTPHLKLFVKGTFCILLIAGSLFQLANSAYAQSNPQPKEIQLWPVGKIPGGTGPRGLK